MICPECKAAGRKSDLQIVRPISPDIGSVTVFRDGDGVPHLHDSNVRTTQYGCSNGHSWSETRQTPCWCGWPDVESPTAADLRPIRLIASMA